MVLISQGQLEELAWEREWIAYQADRRYCTYCGRHACDRHMSALPRDSSPGSVGA